MTTQDTAALIAAAARILQPCFPDLTAAELCRRLQEKGTPAQAPQFYTVKQVADAMQCTPRTVRNWISDGRLQAVKISRSAVRIPAAELQQLEGGA